MAEIKDKILKIHLFYSVKGGSGKTANATFRVFNTIFRSPPGENGVGTDINDPRICFVDADFRGTMLESIYANHFYEQGASSCFVKGFMRVPEQAMRADRENREFRYYSQDIIDMSHMTVENRLDRVMYCMEKDEVIGGTGGTTGKHFKHPWAYNIAFCNPDYNTKNMFVTNTTNFDGEFVKIDHFRAQFKDFIYLLAETHDVIVIDMAPGKDEYAKAIFEICYDMNLGSEFKDYYSTFKGIIKDDAKVKTKVTLHLVTTPDKAHIAATSESLVEIITGLSMLEKAPDAIEVIINEPGYFEYINEKYSGDRLEQKVKDVLGESVITDDNRIITHFRSYLAQHVSQSAADASSSKIKYVYQKYIDSYNFKHWGDVATETKTLFSNPDRLRIDQKIEWNKATNNQFMDTAKVLAAEAEAAAASAARAAAAEGAAGGAAVTILGWV